MTPTLGSMKFAAFDFETTGMDPLLDGIVEAGIVVFQNGSILETYEQLINPGCPVSKEAFGVHGIDEKLLENQPAMNQVLPRILALLDGAVPAAHNAPFDLSFLAEAVRRQGLILREGPVVDTCQLAKTFFPEFSTHRLSFLAEKLDLSRDQSHRALSDARSCHSLMCKIVDKLPMKWETSWDEFCGLAGGTLSLGFRNVELPEKFAPLKKAFAARDRVILSYQDGKGQITKRQVTPMGLSVEKRKTVLIGYCHLRQGTRSFRLDRILNLEFAAAPPAR